METEVINMKKISQKQRVIKKLMVDGFVTRNSALRNYISRLSVIIQDLESDGWKFKTSNVNGDYMYIVKESPLKQITYIVADGREIKNYA